MGSVFLASWQFVFIYYTCCDPAYVLKMFVKEKRVFIWALNDITQSITLYRTVKLLAFQSL